MRSRRLALLAVAALLAPLAAGCLGGDPRPPLLLASTTSARDTGLLDAVEAAYEASADVNLRYVAVGSGQAMELGRRGDADVLLVHSPDAERAFVAAGHGLFRRAVMHNEFLLVGPHPDPARIEGEPNVSRALAGIAAAKAPFASRGDESGTHAKERALWNAAGFDPSRFERGWYKETGTGMAATLRFASEVGAYALTDDGTWLKLKAGGDLAALTVITRGDPAMRNPYSVIPVAAAKHPGVAEDRAVAFAEWLTGPEGQAVIGGLAIGGDRLFTPAREA